jgi:hypothetical protein
VAAVLQALRRGTGARHVPGVWSAHFFKGIQIDGSSQLNDWRPAPDNREPAMTDVHLLPRRIALLLLLADLIGLILAFNLANWLRLGSLLGLPFDILLPIAVLILALYVLDCYSMDTQVSGMRAAPRTLVAVLLGASSPQRSFMRWLSGVPATPPSGAGCWRSRFLRDLGRDIADSCCAVST